MKRPNSPVEVSNNFAIETGIFNTVDKLFCGNLASIRHKALHLY